MKVYQKNIIFILILTVIALAGVSKVWSAGSQFIPDCVATPTKSCDDVSVFITLAIVVARYIFTFVGAVALLFFVYGGFMMIISRGNTEKIGQGTKAMTAAVVGLVVAFSGYALITFLGKAIGLQGTYLINKNIEKLENNNFWV
jgi:hypothetical protein